MSHAGVDLNESAGIDLDYVLNQSPLPNSSEQTEDNNNSKIERGE